MGEIVLVRHGQANSAADNEADYDRLSDLGHRQARWLGEWLAARGERFDAVVSGSLRRHRETAVGMGHADAAVDPRLNEMDYFNLGRALENVKGIPFAGADSFPDHVPLVMQAWHAAEIQGDESFAAFEMRVTAAVIEAATEGRRVLAITSGGVIGMVMRHVLHLDPTRLGHVLTPIRNTSIHRLQVRGAQMILTGFNSVPHLEADDRTHAVTDY
ncbi:phosphoglycerate mutase family protein [Oceaniovalibus guishaninsula JLT2003]|uniref:Phosphoglycerate mutase family protein n=1 Tax=Oceaniovalibus guishaninsula JLT2003 TaxID=1231392 RepID=K2HKJ6_9RHOB|nr:histidine phosphatase family protein [Oceaniovalibus guishaninsula]EKE43464.1 phosphoglycerate mutase family protein [Oceaniovalibus guishaninsula JLT2003]